MLTSGAPRIQRHRGGYLLSPKFTQTVFYGSQTVLVKNCLHGFLGNRNALGLTKFICYFITAPFGVFTRQNQDSFHQPGRCGPGSVMGRAGQVPKPGPAVFLETSQEFIKRRAVNPVLPAYLRDITVIPGGHDDGQPAAD